jgi:nucleoid-associated protein YgaU
MFGRIVIISLLAISLWAIVARESGATGPARSYRVQAGDTLWSIAAATYAGDPREGIWKLEQRNDLPGTTITPGQLLRLP